MVAIPKVTNWKTGLLIIGVVALVVATGYFGWQYKNTQELLKDPQAAAIQETNNLIKLVSRHTVLPGGETPTIATVSDKTKLAGQPFFARAEVGDKVLIYAKEGRAVLYRPSISRIVEMTTMVTQSATPEPQLSEAGLAIYNGTQTQGLAIVAELRLKDLKNLKVLAKQNAVKEYKKSTIILLNARAKNLATQLASLVKAEIVTDLPEGENKPAVDILLILGEDFK